nr:uncharacterized protein LOC113727472 [Coffea arabica]
MSGFGRMKRVTDPLHDKVKARIVPDCFSSGGSDHSADAAAAAAYDEEDVISPSLSELVYGSLVDDACSDSPADDDSDSERDSSVRYYDSAVNSAEDSMNRIAQKKNADSFEKMLCADVTKAMEVFSGVKSNMPVLRRNVMAFLRKLGYNAAICKTKWESSGGLSSGDYEFIDVLRFHPPNRSTRYIVDLDFAKEFEIARPTAQYEHAVRSIPRVFIGRSEELKQVLKVMSDAAKRSLKSRGLLLPPWRKHRYMQSKWLGAYKRTTNIAPVFPQPPPLMQKLTVKCRSVGFDVVAVS